MKTKRTRRDGIHGAALGSRGHAGLEILASSPRITERWRKWVETLRDFAMREAEMMPDLTEDYWRQCFLDGMSPEQAFRESFTEQDGI